MSKKKLTNSKDKEKLCELYAEAICDFKEYFKCKKKSLAAKKKKTKKKPEPE